MKKLYPGVLLAGLLFSPLVSTAQEPDPAPTTRSISQDVIQDQGHDHIRIGLAENAPSSLELYPQPSGESLRVNFPHEGWRKLEVYSLCGKLVLQKISKSQEAKLDLSMLRPGVYFLRVEGYPTQRFLKE